MNLTLLNWPLAISAPYLIKMQKMVEMDFNNKLLAGWTGLVCLELFFLYDLIFLLLKFLRVNSSSWGQNIKNIYNRGGGHKPSFRFKDEVGKLYTSLVGKFKKYRLFPPSGPPSTLTTTTWWSPTSKDLVIKVIPTIHVLCIIFHKESKRWVPDMSDPSRTPSST